MSEAENIEYVRKKLGSAIKMPEQYRGHDGPPKPNPIAMDDDFYLVRWNNLAVEKVTQTFPTAQPMEDDEGMRTFFFLDAVGNKQFIIGFDKSDVVASHGRHTLSVEQHQRLVEAGAEFFL